MVPRSLFCGMQQRSYLVFLAFLAQAADPCIAQSPYRIPVVVHVIHDDGPENISQAQLRNGIEILTRNWRKQNPDTVDIIPLFQPIAADMEVEFAFARRDPQGNCTSGIQRIRSPLTLPGNHDVKNLDHWPPDRYLNIYVTRGAAGLAGHALMPFQAEQEPQWDGVVIQGSYFGNIGTSDDLKSVVLSHEAGHYLDLYHVWGGNNVPGFFYQPVGLQENCDIGDEVEDTPATIGWSTCNVNAISCDGQVDNVQNFMDYAYCARMFTQGQKERVHAALNSPVAGRNNLWTSENLALTGLMGAEGLCKADFRAPRRLFCAGDVVQLEDASYHDPISWQWNVGGGPILTDQDPVLGYSGTGHVDISLSVSDGINTMSVTKPRFFRILEHTGAALPYLEGFEDMPAMEASDLFAECEELACWELTDVAAATGDRSARVINVAPGKLYNLYTPRLDLTQVPDPVIHFRIAHAQRQPGDTDKLVVSISRDCGATWLVRRTLIGAELATAGLSGGGGFIPNSSEWRDELISNIPQPYRTDNVVIRFAFTSGGGNDLYLDDINVLDASTVHVEALDHEDWQLVPNPALDHFRIHGPFPRADVEIRAQDGRVEATHAMHDLDMPIQVGQLAAGIYMVRTAVQGHAISHRLVVTGH